MPFSVESKRWLFVVLGKPFQWSNFSESRWQRKKSFIHNTILIIATVLCYDFFSTFHRHFANTTFPWVKPLKHFRTFLSWIWNRFFFLLYMKWDKKSYLKQNFSELKVRTICTQEHLFPFLLSGRVTTVPAGKCSINNIFSAQVSGSVDKFESNI